MGMAEDFVAADIWKDRIRFSEENLYKFNQVDSDIFIKLQKLSTFNANQSGIISCIESMIKNPPWKKADGCVFIKHYINCYILASDNVIVFRHFVKLMNKLRKDEVVENDGIKSELSEIMWPLLRYCPGNISTLMRVCNILDIDNYVRSILRDNISEMIQITSSVLKQNQQDTDYRHLATKLSLQCFLLSPEYQEMVGQLLQDSSDLTEHLHTILQSLVNIIFIEDICKETISLAVTSVTMTINTLSDPAKITQIFDHFIVSMDTDESNVLDIGTVHLKLPKLKSNIATVKLSMLKSMVTCSSAETLCYRLESKGENSVAFIMKLFSLICKLCNSNEELYFCFQLYSLWFKQLVKLWPKISKTVSQNFEDKLISESIKYVWINLESPVDDVNQYVIEILHSLLELGLDENKQEEIRDSLLTSCMSMPWNVRSRYKPLQILIPYLNLKQLKCTIEEIKLDLLKCMSCNYLVPHASDVYKVFLQSLLKYNSDKAVQLQCWIETWRDLILKGILSKDSLTCNKVNTYWIPLTLKFVPSSGEYLNTSLITLLESTNIANQRQKILLTWCVVVKTARNLTGVNIDTLNKDVLNLVLYCDNEDVRIEGLALICNTNKKAEALCGVEIELLKGFLPSNQRVDSPPFRQLLATHLQRLLIRIRDSCYSFLKKKACTKQLDDSLQFVDWLHNLFINNLVPGVSFQRRKTCLDNLDIIYQVFLSTPPSDKPTQTKGLCGMVLQYAIDKGFWEFFSHQNFVCLTHCLLDGADEIREKSYSLLQSRYHWTLEGETGLVDIKKLSCHLLVESLRLCNKPKACDSHSGALLVCLIFNKFVSLGLQYSIDRDPDKKLQIKCLVIKDVKLARNYFLDILISELQESINIAETNPVVASQTKPIHGVLQAITMCIDDLMSCDQNRIQLLDERIKQVVTFCIKIVNIMLVVMSGGKQYETCLSFAELGTALETMVTDGGQSDNVVLSPEFQCLLSWCWVNLKTCCTSLSDVLSIMMKSGSTDVHTTANTIKHVYFKVLTNCRHRGAIEGCRNGLMKFSMLLMSCTDTELREIPYSLIDKVYLSLESNKKMASVTRRSAGLPIIIHVLTVAAKKNKMNKLVDDILNKLYQLASEPIPSDWDQTQDFPTVHALNILKAVFGDSSLASSLMSLYSKMVLLVIDSFESPCWAVRNAASQLFSTLVLRMFGPKGGGNCLTLEEFSAHYPTLPPFLLQKLDESILRLDNQLQPTLYLVLTILSSLSPSTTDNELPEQFRKKIVQLLKNPIYSLRELSALSLVALVPIEKTNDWLKDMMKLIPIANDNNPSHNHLHGTLMFIEKLVQDRKLSISFVNQFIEDILQRSWLISSCCRCRLLSQKYCQIIHHLVANYSSNDFRDSLKNKLGSVIVTTVIERGTTYSIGGSVYITAAVELLTQLYKDEPRELVDYFILLLQCKQTDVRLICLKQIKQLLQDDMFQLNWSDIQNILWKLLLEPADNSLSCIKLLCDILTEIKLRNITTTNPDVPQNLDLLYNYCQEGMHHYILPLQAIVLIHSQVSRELESWCEKIRDGSHPDQNEDVKILSVKGLTIAGHVIFNMADTNRDSTNEKCVVSLIESSLLLLDEEDTEIRKMAASYISKLLSNQKRCNVTNSNYCIKQFLSFICDKFWWSGEVFYYLLYKLYKRQSAGNAIKAAVVDNKQNFQVMFDHDDNSFFSEKILRLLDFRNCLKDILKKRAQDNIPLVMEKQFWDPHITFLKDDFNECMGYLDMLKEDQIINITSLTSVVSSLTGLLLYCDIVTTSQPSHKDIPLLQINTFLQIKCLHPWYSQFKHYFA